MTPKITNRHILDPNIQILVYIFDAIFIIHNTRNCLNEVYSTGSAFMKIQD